MKNLKHFLLLLVLCLLPLLPLFSDVILTDEEYDQTITALNKSIEASENLKKENNLLKQELNNTKETSKEDLEKLTNEVAVLQSIISSLQMGYNLQLKLSNVQKKDQIIKSLEDIGLGFLIGFVGGYVTKDAINYE